MNQKQKEEFAQLCEDISSNISDEIIVSILEKLESHKENILLALNKEVKSGKIGKTLHPEALDTITLLILKKTYMSIFSGSLNLIVSKKEINEHNPHLIKIFEIIKDEIKKGFFDETGEEF